MPLMEKGRWRRWLGMRGNLWYYQDPLETKSRLLEPAVWSATIAAFSTILTAIFAYQNFALSRRTFSVVHQPKLVAVWLRALDKENGKWSYTLRIRNDGDQPADDVSASIPISDTSDPFLHFVDFHQFSHQTIQAGEMNGFGSGDLSMSPIQFHNIFQVDIFYGPGSKSLEVCGHWNDLQAGKHELPKEMFVALRACELIVDNPTPVSDETEQ